MAKNIKNVSSDEQIAPTAIESADTSATENEVEKAESGAVESVNAATDDKETANGTPEEKTEGIAADEIKDSGEAHKINLSATPAGKSNSITSTMIIDQLDEILTEIARLKSELNEKADKSSSAHDKTMAEKVIGVYDKYVAFLDGQKTLFTINFDKMTTFKRASRLDMYDAILEELDMLYQEYCCNAQSLEVGCYEMQRVLSKISRRARRTVKSAIRVFAKKVKIGEEGAKIELDKLQSVFSLLNGLIEK